MTKVLIQQTISTPQYIQIDRLLIPIKRILAGLASVILVSQVQAQTQVSVEGAFAWQTKNDQRIPGNSGTLFSLSDLDSGPFPVYRVYLGHTFNQKHEIRALYAPFVINVSGRLNQPVQFANSTFSTTSDVAAKYRFNSYRLTYAYHFDPVGDWNFAFGFTGKIRDAEVRLTQGTTQASKANVGFVPLLNFQAQTTLSEGWGFRFDFDGLAAPQGRAFDIGIFLERSLLNDFKDTDLITFLGYRMVEGGADNTEVYSFAFVQYATLGLRGTF